MGIGGGRDIWWLTSNPSSPISHNTKARLGEDHRLDKKGQSILIRTEGWNANAASNCPLNQIKMCTKKPHPSKWERIGHSLSNWQRSTKSSHIQHISVLTKATNGVAVSKSLQQDARLLWLAFLVVTQPETQNSNRIWGGLPTRPDGGAVKCLKLQYRGWRD